MYVHYILQSGSLDCVVRSITKCNEVWYIVSGPLFCVRCVISFGRVCYIMQSGPLYHIVTMSIISCGQVCYIVVRSVMHIHESVITYNRDCYHTQIYYQPDQNFKDLNYIFLYLILHYFLLQRSLKGMCCKLFNGHDIYFPGSPAIKMCYPLYNSSMIM